MMTDHKRTYSQRGDDYLLEAQRVCGEDKRGQDKPTPRCPYCGEEMRENGSISHRWYMCPYCLSAGPRKIIDMTGYPNEELAVVDATQKAREAAMKHWQEPNRVLTLEEIISKVSDASSGVPVWVEHINDTGQKLAWKLSGWQVVRDAERCVLIFEIGYSVDTRNINKTWRCWLRKPTQEEMKAIPWESL